MGQVNGLVLKRISKKSGRSDRGPWEAYSLCVGPEGNDDNDDWYRNGFKAPAAAEGSVVSFEYEEKDGNRTVKGAINVDKAKTAAVAKKGGGVSNDARQNSIVRQNSTTTATAIATAMIANEIVKLPAQAKRYDFFLELINGIADHLFPTLINPPSLEELKGEGVELPDKEDDGPTEEEMWTEG